LSGVCALARRLKQRPVQWPEPQSQRRPIWNGRACAFVRSKITIIFSPFDVGDMLRIIQLISSAGCVAHLAHSVEKSLRHKMDAARLLLMASLDISQKIETFAEPQALQTAE